MRLAIFRRHLPSAMSTSTIERNTRPEINLRPIDLEEYLTPAQLGQFHHQRLLADRSTREHLQDIIEAGMAATERRNEQLDCRPETLMCGIEEVLPIMFPAKAARLLNELCEAGGIFTFDYVREMFCSEIYQTLDDSGLLEGVPEFIMGMWQLDAEDVSNLGKVVARWRAMEGQ